MELGGFVTRNPSIFVELQRRQWLPHLQALSRKEAGIVDAGFGVSS
jgi:hypothetical protein